MKATELVILTIILWGLSVQPLSAQESILKDHIEHKRDRKFAFYPSTLRMVNLERNDDYDQLVNGVEKLLVYTLDSITIVDKSYTQISESYLEAGFEEYATIYGGEMTMSILGKEGSKTQEMVGYFSQKETAIAFYLRGNIPWQKIPSLMQNIQQLEVIDFFDVKNFKF
ncbi:MAG: DUF4252 domain-containing protein [Marinoscillum sp.]